VVGRKTLLRRADVEAAAEWLDGKVAPTPVIRSTALDEVAGARLWLKAENLQQSGSYKYRGALRAVGRIADQGRCVGVIAQSTGNHALAQLYNMTATVVLPVDASAVKVAGVEAAGAKVILAGTTVEERLAVVTELERGGNLAVIDAYDHPDVVAGQGTASLELIEAARRRNTQLGAVVVPVGGGGGVAGACLAAEGQHIDVYGVEPRGCDSMAHSLLARRRIVVQPAQTLADGLKPSCVGKLPFEIVCDVISGVLTVTEAAIAQAFCLVLFHTKLLVEPSAAVGLAGALSISSAYDDIGIVLTGGNAEPSVVARLAAGHLSTTNSEGD
jgi:threonine dehydratase